jgi:hypothetical protein
MLNFTSSHFAWMNDLESDGQNANWNDSMQSLLSRGWQALQPRKNTINFAKYADSAVTTGLARIYYFFSLAVEEHPVPAGFHPDFPRSNQLSQIIWFTFHFLWLRHCHHLAVAFMAYTA